MIFISEHAKHYRVQILPIVPERAKSLRQAMAQTGENQTPLVTLWLNQYLHLTTLQLPLTSLYFMNKVK